jgi:long-chain acyl-CoA synthetase
MFWIYINGLVAVVRTQTRPDTTIYSAFEKVARCHPERVALKAKGGRGRSYTYGEVRAIVKQLSSGLSCGKFTKKAEVGLISENRPEWGIAYLAILAAGKTVVPIDASLKGDEVSFIIDNAGLDVIFTSGSFENLLKTLRPEIEIFSFDEDSPNSWMKLTNANDQTRMTGNNKTAVLMYTSGTTGIPKAVELTHENILANLRGIASALQFDQNDTFLSVLPLHHTLEATCGFLTPLMSGSTIVYARSLKSKEIFEDIAFNAVTLMCGVPLLFEKMYHSIQRGISSAPVGKRLLFHLLYFLSSVTWCFEIKWGKPLFRDLRNKAGLGTIRMFVSGGAALPPKIARFFNLIGFDFLQGYGMTECSPVISVNQPDNIKFGSVGPPLENIEVKIDSPGQGGIGEILVKGDNVTPGYRNNPEKTAELVIDGWLHTGDLGRLKDGHLWITGRRKNVIVSAAGKNIYPEELEEKLLESSCVLETVVFGRKKQKKQGEEVRALIVPDLKQIQADFGIPEENPDLERIKEKVAAVVKDANDHVANYKRIIAFDVQLEELEKTSTKKVKRFLYK